MQLVLIAFVLGFGSAIALIAGLVYEVYRRSQAHLDDRLRASARLRATQVKEIAGAATLDPLRVIAKVQLGPADDGLLRGPLRYGRVTLYGHTLSLYETVIVEGADGDVTVLRPPEDGIIGNSATPVENAIPSGATVTERLIGKIALADVVAAQVVRGREDTKSTIDLARSTWLVLHKTGEVAMQNAMQVAVGPDDLSSDDEGGRAPRVISCTSPPLFVPSSLRADLPRAPSGASRMSLSQLDACPAQWRSLRLRFSTLRELERVQNVLAATPVTRQWREFIRTLPHIDVFNLFVARVFFENRELEALKVLITNKVNKKLAAVEMPRALAESRVSVHSVCPGTELPLISNVSHLSTCSTGEIAYDLDFWYRGGFTLQLRLDLQVRQTRLPAVVATILIRELRGRLHVSIGAPPSHKMWLGFHEAPEVAIEFRHEMADGEEDGIFATALRMIPDLSDIITNIVRVQIFDDMTLPHLDDFPLPNVEESPPTTPRAGADTAKPSPTGSAGGGPQRGGGGGGGVISSPDVASTPTAAAVASRSGATNGTAPLTPVQSAQAVMVPAHLRHRGSIARGHQRNNSGGSSTNTLSMSPSSDLRQSLRK